jgi:hypothetical protein
VPFSWREKRGAALNWLARILGAAKERLERGET